MDISTCAKKLKNGKYQFIEECINDIQLIWDNCKHYNAFGSWIYNLAVKLEKLTKKLIEKDLAKYKFPCNYFSILV